MRETTLKIEELPIESLKPYDNNAKRHTNAQIDAVKASISEFGFRNPVIVWRNEDGVPEVVAGHARVTAAKALGMKRIPCVSCDDLDDAQRRALTLADNQTTMMTGWDEDMLAYELDVLSQDFEMADFGFCDSVDFSNLSAMAEDTEESLAFAEKFKPKKTTDDCYTPQEVYEVIRDWACDEYGIDPSKVVRPFYPGGDYERFDYSGGKVVIDNPPFSILSKIIRFYVDNGVPFFLFCPTLTGLSGRSTVMDVCHVICGCKIVYENGASVNTSFVTSYGGDVVARTAPKLREIVDAKVEELQKEGHAELPKYEYPDEVITAAILGRWSRYGVEFEVSSSDCMPIDRLDAQKESGDGIYGGGAAPQRESSGGASSGGTSSGGTSSGGTSSGGTSSGDEVAALFQGTGAGEGSR